MRNFSYYFNLLTAILSTSWQRISASKSRKTRASESSLSSSSSSSENDWRPARKRKRSKRQDRRSASPSVGKNAENFLKRQLQFMKPSRGKQQATRHVIEIKTTAWVKLLISLTRLKHCLHIATRQMTFLPLEICERTRRHCFRNKNIR